MPESGPITADKAKQQQARAPETAGNDSEFLPPGAMGILDLQRKAGNRAVTSAIASGAIWSMPGGRPMPIVQLLPAVQRTAGNRAATALRRQAKPIQRTPAKPIQRTPAKPIQRAPAGSLGTGGMAAVEGPASSGAHNAIVAGLHSAVEAAHGKMEHVPAAKADTWIGVIDVYTKTYPKREDIGYLFAYPEDLYELLAPWGFVGRAVVLQPDGRLTEYRVVENLLQSIKVWKGDDARRRRKRRAKAHSTMGYYDRDVKLEETERDDRQVLAGPNRSDPSEPWGPSYTGTRKARRAERERLKNEHALGQISAIKNQGPGGFAGMIAGGLIGSLPGMDFHKTTELLMQVGSMADALIMTRVNAAEMQGVSGGAADRYTDGANVSTAPKREPMPAPNLPGAKPGGGGGPRKTSQGPGAAGPAGQGAQPRAPSPDETQLGMGAAGSAGQGARPRPGRPTMQGPAVGVGAVGQQPGGGANKTLKAGPVAQVTPEQVIKQFKGDPNTVNHSASDYWHTVQWIDALIETGQWDMTRGPVPPPPLAFRVKGGHVVVNDLRWVKEGRPIRAITEPHRWGSGGGGKSGTQVGVPAGPGGSAKGGGTQVGVPPGPGGTAKPAAAGGSRPGYSPPKVPSGPPPVPPGNTVRAASVDEALAAHAKDPYRVVVHVDNPEWHQYIWELRNWQDGKRVTTPAPTAFHAGNGYVYVFANRWAAEGRNPAELLPPREATEFEAARTLPGVDSGGGGGGSSTMATPPPGARRK